MKNTYKKLFLLIIPIMTLCFYATVEVSAQSGGCDVLVATTRTTRALGPDFFQESNRPYFYIDIGTQNCIGQSIEVSITEDDVQGDPDDDVDGTLGVSDDCTASNNTCMDNRIINVTSATTGNFTLALIAGEDECEVTYDPECAYHVETFDDVDDFEWPQVSGYDCDGICDIDWQYLGIIPYQTTHTNDPDVAGGNGGGNGSTTGNASATASGFPTVINLNLQNPIGGVDANTGIHSLPEFFQKVLEVIIKIAIPFVAIVLVYCGLLFVTARGDTAQIEKARNAFTYAVIGGLILMASWLIAEAIKDALTSLAYVL